MKILERIETIEILFDDEKDRDQNWNKLIEAGWIYVGKLSYLHFKFTRKVD